MSEVKLYAERDLMGLDRNGNHYCKHILAMTREGLHAKSDIAAELAFRDSELAALREELESWKSRCARRVQDIQLIAGRLTAAEQRNADLIDVLEVFAENSDDRDVVEISRHQISLSHKTESGASE